MPPRHPRRSDEPIVLEEFLARVEKELITRALRRAKGNKSKAAKLLGLTRPRLYRRLDPTRTGRSADDGKSSDAAPRADACQPRGLSYDESELRTL